jgi:hypothetical protein
MSLRGRLERLQHRHDNPTRRREWDFCAIVAVYQRLARWLVERNLLLAEAVAGQEAGLPGLPFSLAEALDVEAAPASPDEPGYDCRTLDSWKSPEDYRRSWVEVVRCRGWIGGSDSAVIRIRTADESPAAGEEV